MKIHFVYAYHTTSGSRSGAITLTYPPLGVLYLASYLKKYFKGSLEMKVSDGLLLGSEKTLQEVLDFGADILCVSSLTPTVNGAYHLINKTKEKMPGTFIIMGGVHAAALPEDAFSKSMPDLIVTGEGEQTLLQIIEKLDKKEDYKDIKGIAFKKDNTVFRTPCREFIQDVDSIPFPAYDLIAGVDKYPGWLFTKKRPDIAFFTARGCLFNCVYCANYIWKTSRPALRTRSPKNIVDEMEWLKNNFGVQEIFDEADEFNSNEKWAMDVCDKIIKRKINMPWKCQLRADRLSEELVAKMAKAGCWYVHLGAESGNQRTLDGIGKHITLQQIVDACRLLKKYNIKIMALFMIFNIWTTNGKLEYEGVKESLNTLDFANKLKEDKLADYISWGPTTPYPGSRLFNIAVSNNLLRPGKLEKWEEWNNTWDITVDLPGVAYSDYIKVKNKGVMLQILLTLKNGGINFSTIFTFIERGLRLIKNLFTGKNQ